MELQGPSLVGWLGSCESVLGHSSHARSGGDDAVTHLPWVSRIPRLPASMGRAPRSRSRRARVPSITPDVAALVAICVTCAILAGCGSMLTTKPDPADRFDEPVSGLDNGELGDFQDGHEQFRKAFSIREGLGPVFNNVSCASCHSGDGRGKTENILTRFSRGADLVFGEGGPQLQTRAIPGAAPERLPDGVDVSFRLPPPVFGVGFLEALTESTILAHEDPGDSNGDGISGRANWVTPAPYVPAEEPGGGAAPRVGRFGRKASVSSLLQQTVEAYHQDIGMTTPQRPVENVNPLAPAPNGLDEAPDPEVPGNHVADVIQYMRMLAPPAPGEPTESRRHGEALFASARCAACHIPALRTGSHEIEAIANREIALYSDLLLHDLGDELADGRPDGGADGREWRTAPLWGLRVARDFLAGELLLLHDGRARSVEEAIRAHGGEAAASRDAFLSMAPGERAALLDFVESR
jgi:CxxC motif-containing protein (DUF1111 family)